ncbi:MAG: hypothetical protein HY898_27755 [Deltaproteobacteria bacterium]|nr:hypothetical protein [Deltaproteobacteria bacterium]
MGRPALRPVAPEEEALLDTAEVPAAVVCAICGSPDCLGCSVEEEHTLPSGVIAIIPWERPMGSSWTRLWATASASTLRAESFFGPIPKGEYASALRFSVVCELMAVSSVALAISAGVFAIAPTMSIALLRDPHTRGLVLRLVMLGVPAFAALLVVAHVVYGWAMDRGAVRAGARPHRVQALRFGMYGTGLDLMTSPIGMAYTLLSQGPRAMLNLLPAAFEVPSIACRALLRRVYHLADEPAAKARRYGGILIAILGLAMVIAVMTLLAIAMFV